MKRTTLFCLLSATIGALAATAYHQTASHRQATAQEPGQRPSLLRAVEAPPLPAVRRPAPVVTDRFPAAAATFTPGLDEFAPEERTNIAVYDKANRSVVHITTKSTQRELLILEGTAEGAGSGSVLDR